MRAALLPVDGSLLSRLTAIPFSGGEGGLGGQGPKAGADGLGGGGGGGLGGGRASSPAVGAAQLRLAWEALRACVYARRGPTVLFLRAADKLLCGSSEAYEAFSDVWGSPEILALEGGSRAPVVMVAGCRLPEKGAAARGTGGGARQRRAGRLGLAVLERQCSALASAPQAAPCT